MHERSLEGRCIHIVFVPAGWTLQTTLRQLGQRSVPVMGPGHWVYMLNYVEDCALHGPYSVWPVLNPRSWRRGAGDGGEGGVQ